MAKKPTTPTPSSTPVSSTNPWSPLTWNGKEFYASIDGEFLKNYDSYCVLHKKTNDLRLDCLPEPFVGDPAANVYILGGNPGYTDVGEMQKKYKKPAIKQGEEMFSAAPSYKKWALDSLRHDFSCFDCKNKEHFLYFNEWFTTSSDISIKHPGCDWWQSNTKTLRESYLNNQNPNIFAIEYLPYHSKNLDTIKNFIDSKDYIQPDSNAYTNYLIMKAMCEGKVIVIIRMKKYWLQRIPMLKSYDKLFFSSNSQCFAITPDNIVRYVPEDQFINNIVLNSYLKNK